MGLLVSGSSSGQADDHALESLASFAEKAAGLRFGLVALRLGFGVGEAPWLERE